MTHRGLVGVAMSMALCGCAAQPIEQVDAPVELVRRTRAFALGGAWHSLTRYCVAQDGSVTEVETVRVSGDPELDALHREAVAKWRYRPTKIDRGRCHFVETRENFGEEKSEGQEEPPEPGTVAANVVKREDLSPAAIARILFEKGARGWDYTNRTSFCVEIDGTVGSVRTLRRTGLEELDAHARATVETWKFEPMTVGGQPRRVCSDVTFSIRTD